MSAKDDTAVTSVTKTVPPDTLGRSQSIDLDPEEARIFSFAALSLDADAPCLVARGKVNAEWVRPVPWCQGNRYVLGHNTLRHDLRDLAAAAPRFAKLSQAPIDTL